MLVKCAYVDVCVKYVGVRWCVYMLIFVCARISPLVGVCAHVGTCVCVCVSVGVCVCVFWLRVCLIRGVFTRTYA